MLWYSRPNSRPTLLAVDSIGCAFEPRDLWLGLYWDLVVTGDSSFALHLYFCLVPLLPIHVVLVSMNPSEFK